MSWSASVTQYDVVDSTMQCARSAALQGAAHGTTVVARAQSAGRGRRGRVWVAPAGAALLMTTVLRPTAAPLSLSQVPLVAGLAVCRAMHVLGATGARLKWPNDVLVGERKLAGILLEAEALDTPAPWLLVGIGVNVAPRAQLTLPSEIDARYIGLAECVPPDTAPHVDLALRAILTALQADYDRWQSGALAPLWADWAAWDMLRGQRVSAEASGGGRVEGTACGIDDAGRLLLLPRGEGTQMIAIAAGEVSQVRLQ